MTEPDDDSTEPVRKRRLHGARCCTTTPPRLRWDETIEAVVCDSCDRVYAPILFSLEDMTKAAIVRANLVTRGCNTGIGRIIGIDRHAVRRKREKLELVGYADFTVPYADPGPKVADLTG